MRLIKGEQNLPDWQILPIEFGNIYRFGRDALDLSRWLWHHYLMLSLLGKPVAERVLTQTKTRVQRLIDQHQRTPKLVVIIVGDDAASQIYVSKKNDMALQLGMKSETLRFDANASPDLVQAKVHELNSDPSVDGILIQRPLPKSFREENVAYWVSPMKDVDCFHPENTGLLHLNLSRFAPCTPAGVIELLKHYRISLAGKTACVVGRSAIVGKPMATLLLQEDATIIHCHSRTQNLPDMTRLADLLVVAAGKPQLIQRHHLKPGAVVVDVGIHRINGKVVGDVDSQDVSTVASALTPVPGGVGPMTIAMLMQNTVHAAELGVKHSHG